MSFRLAKLVLTTSLLLLSQSTYSNERHIVVGIPPISGILNYLKLESDITEVLMPSGIDPHTFDISPSKLEKLSRADLFFHTKFPFELKTASVLKQTNSRVIVVDVTKGIKWRKVSREHHHTTYDEAHCDEELDLHCWLHPDNLKIIAHNILEGLLISSDNTKDKYEEKYNEFLQKLEEVDTTVRAKLKPYKGRKFFVYHPAFGYFAEAYGLEEVYIEVDGRAPSLRELRTLTNMAKTEGIRTIYIQPQFDRKPAEIVAKAISAKVEIIDDLNEDVLHTILEIGEKLSQDFSFGRGREKITN